MNTDKIKMCIIYVYNRSSPEIFKNPSTGLKLTKIRLDLVEKSRDQVKIKTNSTERDRLAKLNFDGF